jgi:hypothetical protein
MHLAWLYRRTNYDCGPIAVANHLLPGSKLMKKSYMTQAVAIALLALASGQIAQASSHREAPFITEHPKVDGADFYMFRSYEPGH